MTHENDIKRIRASVFGHLQDGFSGNVHWPGVEGADDDIWVEPWLNLTGVPARARDFLYTALLSINLFCKPTGNTYTLDELAGELTALFKGVAVEVTNAELVVKAYAKFAEPEIVDLGETTSPAQGHTLRQYSWRCNGTVFPIAD